MMWKALLAAVMSGITSLSGCIPDADAQPSPARTVEVAPGAWWRPAVGATFHIQYTGEVDLDHDVDVYNLDWQRTGAAEVRHLTDRGVAAVCYLNAGAYEDFRPDESKFPESVLGEELDGWPGERWLDVRQIDTLLPIMTARMDVCKSKGFVAIDPDNTDGWLQDSGFSISKQNQIAYQKALADAAHERGLAIGLKNNPGQIDDLADVVDFAVNEECVAYGECDLYDGFLAGGKAVFNIEYRGLRATVCPGRPEGMSTVIARLLLDGTSVACS